MQLRALLVVCALVVGLGAACDSSQERVYIPPTNPTPYNPTTRFELPSVRQVFGPGATGPIAHDADRGVTLDDDSEYIAVVQLDFPPDSCSVKMQATWSASPAVQNCPSQPDAQALFQFPFRTPSKDGSHRFSFIAERDGAALAETTLAVRVSARAGAPILDLRGVFVSDIDGSGLPQPPNPDGSVSIRTNVGYVIHLVLRNPPGGCTLRMSSTWQPAAVERCPADIALVAPFWFYFSIASPGEHRATFTALADGRSLDERRLVLRVTGS